MCVRRLCFLIRCGFTLKQKPFYKQKPLERKFKWGTGFAKEIDNTGQFIKKISEVPSCCLDPKEEQSDIQEFFRGCDVLITGKNKRLVNFIYHAYGSVRLNENPLKKSFAQKSVLVDFYFDLK